MHCSSTNCQCQVTHSIIMRSSYSRIKHLSRPSVALCVYSHKRNLMNFWKAEWAKKSIRFSLQSASCYIKLKKDSHLLGIGYVLILYYYALSPTQALCPISQCKESKNLVLWTWNSLRFEQLSRHMLVQNFIKLSAAVNELSWSKNSDENNSPLRGQRQSDLIFTLTSI